MPGRAMATRRRHVQARRVRRFEMERPNVVAVINEGAAWTAVNAQRVPGLALALASAFILVYLFANPQFFVYGAQISGNQRLSTQQVYDASGIDMTSIFFVAPGAVETHLLEALPGLREVRVALQLPAELKIRVQEKSARLVWEAAGESYLVDEGGVVIGTGGAAPGVVRISAPGGEALAEGQALDGAVLDTAVRLSELLGAREFEYTSSQGIGWRTQDGWPVYFGVGNDLPQKVAVMRTVAAQLAQEGVTPEFLDVSVPARPYYR